MALALSIGACTVTALLLLRFRSTSAAKQSERLTELENSLDTLAGAMKNIRARLNMQSYRERKASVDQPLTESSNDADAWRKRGMHGRI